MAFSLQHQATLHSGKGIGQENLVLNRMNNGAMNRQSFD